MAVFPPLPRGMKADETCRRREPAPCNDGGTHRYEMALESESP